ncbi:hypothetical protein UFOVP71_451 [uncultured Caudovirales phage]|uniref:Uncharacterized protein n=1 Tax=uncultured Caudovirales phage TaxID=2100421 RepID=A0A6J5TAT9_9CAUD|nr:hypothetical protein UFOVP71_451 [uncultured Caudovirales phage]
MAEIQFELRKRVRQRNEFWSILYDPNSGQIQSIEPGQSKQANCLVISYAKVKDILAGKLNQNDFKISFNENLGAVDLVNITRPTEFIKKHVWKGWLSTSEYHGDPLSDLRIILFNDTGIIRVESTRAWATDLKEKLDRDIAENDLPLFITDSDDPHQLLGFVNVNLIDIIERGYWESRLWSFMDHGLVQKILYHGKQVRTNSPPVASGMFFTRINQYSPYRGVTDDQTIISHNGRGRHISVFLKDGGVWAQSHYEPGSAIDQLIGNFSVAIINGDDPDDFYSWAELPALMLRQPHPFELLTKWPHQTLPNVLYKANNLDIGVLQ